MYLLDIIVTPLRAIKKRYIPLLLIYFAYGASGFTAISMNFWVKKTLTLSAEELIALDIWLTVPWTIKMIFGQLVDSVSLFGSNRKIYVFIGAGLIALGMFIMILLTSNHAFLALYDKNSLYILASVISVIGFVLQDVVADTMSTEVVDINQRQEEIQHELAMIQVLSRLALGLSAFMVAGIGGWLAEIYSYSTMFTIGLFIPILSLIGVLVVKLNPTPISPLNRPIFFGGLLFAIFTITIGYNDIPYAQEIVFFVSLAVVLYMLSRLTEDLSPETIRHIQMAMIIIFVYRAMPSVGPALQWWEIDVLGFDEGFFGTLAQIGSLIALVGMWVSSKYIINQSIGKVLMFLTILGFFLSLPTLGLYYGLHIYLGVDAQTVALVDTAISSPFTYISGVLMLTLVAIYAPAGKKGTWFALMASLMNIALSASGLFTKYLNKIFILTREVKENGVVKIPANYDDLGILLWIVILIGTIVPLVVIYKFDPQKHNTLNQS
jgi:MFS family permease